MKTSEEILTLLKYGEKINLECKKAENGLPKSVWETYSSFANTSGGIILLGIEENQKEGELSRKFIFADIKNADKLVTDFWKDRKSVV